MSQNPLSILAGDLRHQVQIQMPPSAPNQQDEYGGELPGDWSTVRTTWARISTANSTRPREAYQADEFSAQVTHIISVRYTATPPITGGMRVLFGSHVYLIQTVDNIDQRNVRVDLMCLEINGAQ